MVCQLVNGACENVSKAVDSTQEHWYLCGCNIWRMLPQAFFFRRILQTIGKH